MSKTGDELATSNAIAGDLGVKVEVRVASQEKADLLRLIVRGRRLESIIVVKW